MPKNLHAGDVLERPLSSYTVESDTCFEGGQAKGYYVKDPAGLPFFLKMFKEPTTRSPDAGIFVQRQRALMAKLAEIPDFVCQDVDFFESSGTFYKVSERMVGNTLKDRLDRAAESSNPEFWSQSDRMLNARVLAYTIREIHEHNIVHLDLKPENCFLAERVMHSSGKKRLVIRLLDFDGALVGGAPPPSRILGTANYWSPEHQAPEKFGPPGPASDVFTLGIMLYQILARRYPFVSERGFMTRACDHPAKLAPWLSPSSAKAIWHALAPSPTERPPAKELHAALLDEPAAPGPPAPPPPDVRAVVPLRVALLAAGRRIRFWQDGVLSREVLRGIAGYEYVSRYQARIFRDADAWVIAALPDTANPTYLNGAPLEPGRRYPLRVGDRVQVGRLELTVDFEYE